MTIADNRSTSVLTTLYERQLSTVSQPVDVMTLLAEIPPGGKGLPPHKHSGPVCVPGRPMLTYVDDELERRRDRRDRRAPRPQ